LIVFVPVVLDAEIKMGRFAWRNLLTRPLRTTLALIGLSIPILGVIGLFSLSGGLRNLVGDTLSKVQGVMVMRDNVPSPVFSTLPANYAEKVRAVPGVRIVAPEIWSISPEVNGNRTFGKTTMDFLKGGKQALGSLFDMPLVQGQEIAPHLNLKSGVYPNSVQERGEGRFLDARDVNTNHIVISRKLSKNHPRSDGKPSGVGDKFTIGGKPFEIIGIYDTGSMLLDVVIVMDINTARELLGVSKETVSTFYVEMNDPSKNDQVSEVIEKAMPDVDARSMNEFMANFGMLMGQLDTFLLMTVSLALLVGIVGIINTMLMSTTERFVEFGVLRTNGWSQGDVLKLVTAESAYLGLLSGIIGCILAYLGVTIGNQFVSGGLKLAMPFWLFGLGIGISLVTGTLGGLYPAWKASRLVPMDAIRLGSR
jgi:putative ABC transport system permease protein